MEMILIKIDSPEWVYMWDWLGNHPINQGLEDPKLAPNNGEVWQYMGSYKNKKDVIHEFRHRNHPVTNDLYKVSLRASESFDDEQIHSSAKIK
jgi:hypothetical protein